MSHSHSFNTMPEDGHLLAGAPKLWQQCKGEFESDVPNDADLAEEAAVPTEELKKVAKWMQQVTTKFGASAAVADGADRDKALQPIADDLVRAYTAAIGTLLSIKRGAGKVLLMELRRIGSTLTEALETLGQSIGTTSMSVSAGKVLDRVKQFERTSTHNRAALRRNLLSSLAHLRDASKELTEALEEAGDEDEEDEDDDDDFACLNEALEPAEKLVVERLIGLAAPLMEVLKKASSSCMPPKDDSGVAVSIGELEMVTLHCDKAASSMDNLAVAATGGLDPPNFEAALVEMRSTALALQAAQFIGEDESLGKAMGALQEAFDAAKNDDDSSNVDAGYPAKK